MAKSQAWRADVFGKKPRNNEEDLIQEAMVGHLRQFGVPDLIWYGVINDTPKSAPQAARAKRMGLVAGVYDIAGSLPGGHAWHLELKTRDGVVSTAQMAFGELCERNGAYHFVAYSINSALAWLRAIGALKPEAS